MISQKLCTLTAFRFIKFLLPYWWQELNESRTKPVSGSFFKTN